LIFLENMKKVKDFCLHCRICHLEYNIIRIKGRVHK
jgi:hypothetical protein